MKNIAHPIRAYHLRFNEIDLESANARQAMVGEQPSADTEPPGMASMDMQPIELAFWDSMKDSKEAADFEAYLSQFAEGSFRALAETRLASLRSNPAEDGAAGGEIADPASDVEMAFWDSIKDSESAADYAAYLEQFPEGAFAALARARLENVSVTPAGKDEASRQRVTDAAALELAFWDSMKDSEKHEDFHEYLKQFPKGTFAGLAKSRLDPS